MIAFKYTDSAFQLAVTSVSTEPSPHNTDSLNREPRPARWHAHPSRRLVSAFLVLVLNAIAPPAHAYTLSLKPASLTLAEGDGEQTISMVITKDGSEIKKCYRLSADIIVRRGGTALEGDDFSFKPHIVEFPDTGKRKLPASQDITVTIVDDDIAEGDESFTLRIHVIPKSSYCFLRSIGSDATVTIKDNDSPSSE